MKHYFSLALAGFGMALIAVIGFWKLGDTNKELNDKQLQENKAVSPGENKLNTETSVRDSSDEERVKINEEELLQQKINEKISSMTLEEKVYQMFIITPEALTGYDTVTAAGATSRNKLEEYPVGGVIYFSNNLINAEQTTTMLNNMMTYSYEIQGLPLFTCIDEEGGRVTRIGNNPAYAAEAVRCMREIEDSKAAFQAGETIGSYLSDLGFNFDFAPDADVLTNSKNNVIGDRSFGDDPERVTDLAVAVSDGLHSQNVMSTFKHFPGHGATEGDTHEGFAYTDRTYEELLSSEFKPFLAAADNEVDAIMVAHISVPNVVGDNTPCTLSSKMITEILRNDIGYNGLVITDALNMGAISQNYSSEEASIMAVNAGVDLILMPKNFNQAADGILKAIDEGRISEERIDESVKRIISAKLLLMEKA